MTFVRHGVDETDGEAFVGVYESNVGGSYLANKADTNAKAVEKVVTVRLRKIVDAMKNENGIEQNAKMNVIVKMDIETYECRAVWGSREIFSDKDK